MNFSLFFLVFGFACYAYFFTDYLSLGLFSISSQITLPLFFAVLELGVFWRGRQKQLKGWKSFLLEKHVIYWAAFLVFTLLSLVTPYLSLDRVFDTSQWIMKVISWVVMLSFAVLAYLSTRKHFLGSMLMLLSFFSIGVQSVPVINWNDDFLLAYQQPHTTTPETKNTTYYRLSQLAYTLYTKNNQILERLEPFGFVKIESNNKAFGVSLIAEIVYTYQFDFEVLHRLKNAKCANDTRHLLQHCPDTNAGVVSRTFQLNRQNNTIQHLSEYKLYLNYLFARSQQHLIEKLIEQNVFSVPFREALYLDDLDTLYNAQLQQEKIAKYGLTELKANTQTLYLTSYK